MLTQLNINDIKMLEVFAYNRTLVRHYDEALLVYRFLSEINPDELRWKLGAGLCLVREGAYDEAHSWLLNINSEQLTENQNQLLSQLWQYITHYQDTQ